MRNALETIERQSQSLAAQLDRIWSHPTARQDLELIIKRFDAWKPIDKERELLTDRFIRVWNLLSEEQQCALKYLLDAVQAPTPGVYKLYRNDELIYIGQSRDIPARVRGHKVNGRVFDRFEFEIIRDPFERTRIEKELIQEHQPRGNTLGSAKAKMFKVLNKLELFLDSQQNDTRKNA